MRCALIFDSSVWRGMPSFAAAPRGPEIRPRDAASAASVSCFSLSARVITGRLVQSGLLTRAGRATNSK